MSGSLMFEARSGAAERVALLERLAVQDEARIALEIEKLRKEC